MSQVWNRSWYGYIRNVSPVTCSAASAAIAASSSRQRCGRVNEVGRGVIVYMFDEGRGIGLLNKVRAYALQDQGHDTLEANHELGFAADMRDYRIGAHILFDLGVRKVRLMTNNPDKVRALEEYGLVVSERVPVEVSPRLANLRYLQTKRNRFGHLLSLVETGKDDEPSD